MGINGSLSDDDPLDIEKLFAACADSGGSVVNKEQYAFIKFLLHRLESAKVEEARSKGNVSQANRVSAIGGAYIPPYSRTLALVV